MRIILPLLVSLSLFSSYARTQEAPDLDSVDVPKEKHNYQSDVARMRKIVIDSLYSHRDVFIRELISNANDALEKLRLTALTDEEVWSGADPLNITIKAVKNEDGPGGRLIISDTGIGMSPEELTKNLGTLAKSGTSDFLAKADSSDSTGTGNLIGAFGLGFYSSFLVADRVYVSSIPPKSSKNPNPTQYVFSSSADDSSFEIYPDPRGNTLGRGSEITLVLKDEALEYLDSDALIKLIQKHSGFSTTFPIYMFTERMEQVPIEEPEQVLAEETPSPEAESTKQVDDEEAVVEEVADEYDEEKETKEPKTKAVLVEEWVQLNPQPPIWMRDPKEVTDDEYEQFYQVTFKDYTKPLAWHHFVGDSGSGVSFRAIVYIPSRLDDSFWQQPLLSSTKDVRLLVKRVLITSDLGEDGLPKWASWVKAIIDAEDLPLNVSRETLQSTKFLKQIKQIILKRLIQMMTKIMEEEDEGKRKELQETYGTALKLGAVEDQKNRDKLAALTRFSTNQRSSTSLDEYLENKRQGQNQIFYLADVGKSSKDLAASVFVEKLAARGYEVFLFDEPLDEVMIQNLRRWKGVQFQDVAKAGLKFGDEDMDPEYEKEQQVILKEKFKPLLDYLKSEAKDIVRDVVISNRLVTSSCAIVADVNGYTANVQKMMSASNSKKGQGPMHEFAKRQRLLEINPRSPLIEGLLRRVEQLPSEEEEEEQDLREVTSILIDGALVRSGFDVPDSNEFFKRVDRVLRRSLGVSETASADASVKPAPPVDPELPAEPSPDGMHLDFADKVDKVGVELPDHLKDQISITMEEIDEFGNPVHDEL